MNAQHSRRRRAIIGALIGATFGAAIACLATFLISEPRFFVDGLIFLGTGALLGGTILGLVARMVAGKGYAVLGGIAGGIGGMVLILIASVIYELVPWPSPRPYPGVEPQVETGGGSWGICKTQIYTVTIPLDKMQQYYDAQMKRYCTNTWQFKNWSSLEYPLCRAGDCEIRRVWAEQYFEIYLCAVSPTQTMVVQMDLWEDP